MKLSLLLMGLNGQLLFVSLCLRRNFIRSEKITPPPISVIKVILAWSLMHYGTKDVVLPCGDCWGLLDKCFLEPDAPKHTALPDPVYTRSITGS